MSPHAQHPIRSIVLATDFSKGANAAKRWAILFAKLHGASVRVLHVAHVPSVNSLPIDIQHKMTRDLESIEAECAAEGVLASSAWRVGKPWETIRAVAGEHDLVVLGARGHTPFLHVSIGSTADRVIRTAPVPVLTIHRQKGDDAHLPRKVLVPTDFSGTARIALENVMRVLGTPAVDPLEITLLHARQPLVEYAETKLPFEEPSEQARQLLDDLAATLSTDMLHITPMVLATYPVAAIEDAVEASGAELIAMGTHGRTGLDRAMLGSVAERVMRRVKCHMLTVTPAVIRSADAGVAGARAS